jgi:hypothetical protein
MSPAVHKLNYATSLVSTCYNYSSPKNPTSKVRIGAVLCYQKIRNYHVGVIFRSVTFLEIPILVSELVGCTNISTGTGIYQSHIVSLTEELDGGMGISKEEK